MVLVCPFRAHHCHGALTSRGICSGLFQVGGGFVNWGYLSNSSVISVTALYLLPVCTAIAFAAASAAWDVLRTKRRCGLNV